MANQKVHIIAIQNGVTKGYVRSVSYARQTFTLTQDINQAKGYVTADAVQGEIDFLSRVGFAYGYVFIYN